MAGMNTPALAALRAVGTVRSTVSTVNRLTGRSKRRAEREARAEAEADARLLADTQASRRAELAAEQAEDDHNAAATRATQARLLRAETQEAERRRRRSLRSAVGRVRAELGSQGLSSTDGSGEAILLGLVRRDAEEAEADRRIEALRLAALDADAGNAARRNLLEQARLAERQRLERLAAGLG